MPVIPIMKLAGADDLPLPRAATPGAAGVDLHAAVIDPILLGPGERSAIPTGVRIALPEGFEGQVRPRSGLARRHGIAMVNSPGTVDSDYRGELQVVLVNLGQEPVSICRGDRIAQLVVARVERILWEETDMLPPTLRGEGGFGHTGV